MNAKNFPWHPLLIPALPVVFLYQHNMRQLSLSDVFEPLILLLLLSVAVWGVGWALLRNFQEGAILASLISLHVFTFSLVYNLANKILWSLGFFDVDRARYYIVAWALVALGIVFLVARSTRGHRFTHSFLNWSALAFLLISLGQVIPFEIKRALARDELSDVDGPSVAQESGHNEGSRPDIYYLVFDRYASFRTLEKDLGFSNEEFGKSLAEKGFYVARESRTNYPKTFMSLASSLNFSHLEELAQAMGPGSGDQRPLTRLLAEHWVGRFLKERGYAYYHFGDWWLPTRQNGQADFNYSFKYLIGNSEFMSLLFSDTIFARVLYELRGASKDSMRRDWTRKKFRNIEKVVGRQGPKFVFAHFMLPHPPFLFDSQGGEPLVSKEKLSRPDRYRKYYVDQLVYANGEISGLLDTILENSENEPVVIIQSDEGPFIYPEFGNSGEDIDWASLDPEILRSHMEILNAYHFPGEEYPDLYSTITPVNSFRVLFNRLFGTSFDLLEDSSFVFSSYDKPYDLIKLED